MTYNVIRLGLPLVGLLLSFGCMQAQESTLASGGDASGMGGHVAYSVGQLVYRTHADLAGMVSQGMQQVYEVIAVDSLGRNPEISISIFPNPTSNDITLRILDFKGEKLFYQLLDAQGNLTRQGQLMSRETQISTSTLPASLYLVHIVDEKNRGVRSYRIIKK